MAPSTPRPIYDGARCDVATSVGRKLAHVMAHMRREVELRMTEHGLTDAQWKPLWMLTSGIATTSFEIAREMGIDAGAVTRMVDRLEAKGLLERERSESDRRVVHLALTPAGQRAAEQIPHVLAAVNNDFLRGFSVTEWKQLVQMLDRMTANGVALQAAKEEA